MQSLFPLRCRRNSCKISFYPLFRIVVKAINSNYADHAPKKITDCCRATKKFKQIHLGVLLAIVLRQAQKQRGTNAYQHDADDSSGVELFTQEVDGESCVENDGKGAGGGEHDDIAVANGDDIENRTDEEDKEAEVPEAVGEDDF
jgi:hypothetical protein